MNAAPTDAAGAPEPDARELEAGSRARLEADLRLTMAQRLEQLDALCRQFTAIAGAARRP
jgi:hypothetical protein